MLHIHVHVCVCGYYMYCTCSLYGMLYCVREILYCPLLFQLPMYVMCTCTSTHVQTHSNHNTAVVFDKGEAEPSTAQEVGVA